MLSILKRFVDPVLEHLGAHLDLAVLRREAGSFSRNCIYTLSRWYGGILAALMLLGAELKGVAIEELRSILTVHLLAKLLRNDRNVFETPKRGSLSPFVDGGQHKPCAVVLDVH